MKNKNKFKIIGSGLLFTSVAIASISVVATQGQGISIINQNENANNINAGTGNNEFKYLFNGSYYDSLDDITNELVNNNPFINSDLYYGDALNAIFDHQTNQLNVNELKKFDQNRISSAYLNAFGTHEQDFNKAKKSFVNEGLVKYKYQDTKGVLHSSYAEAQREILKGIKVDETVFYEVFDQVNNKNVKINPLNKDDINNMKKITLENAKNQVVDPNNKTNTFGLMPMLNIAKNNESDNFVALPDSSWLNNLFTQKISDFSNQIITDFTNILETSFNDSIFTARVKLNYSRPELGYMIEKISGEHPNFITTNNSNNVEVLDELIFKDINYNYLNNFDVFLQREKLKTTPGVELTTQRDSMGRAQADNLIFTDFNNKISKFKLYSVGDDGWGITAYTNTTILQPGSSNGNELSFNVNFELQNEEQFVTSIKDKLIKKWKINTIEQNPTRIIEQEFANKIIKLVIDKLFLNENNYYKINDDYFDIFKYSKNNEVDSLSFSSKLILDKFFKEEKDVFIPEIKNIFLELYQKMDYFLTYKNSPIFQMKDSDLWTLFVLGETLFYEQYLNKFEGNKDLENLLNISNNISIDGKNVSSNNAFVKTTLTTEGIFSMSQGEYAGALSPTKDDPNPIYNNFDYAFNSYNENLKELKSKYSNKLPVIIDDKLIKNTSNILVLTDHAASGSNRKTSNLHYGEFLSLVYDFNESLSKHNDNKKIIYNQPELELVKSTSNKINPAKVIIIYDLLGNVINPGIQLSDDLAMETTSDAMYDSERTILDNIYRTLIVKNDPNKIYYKNDNQTYTLLDYETNFVYKLSYNNKTHYFLTYKDAWLYLRDIIRLEAQRVSV